MGRVVLLHDIAGKPGESVNMYVGYQDRGVKALHMTRRCEQVMGMHSEGGVCTNFSPRTSS